MRMSLSGDTLLPEFTGGAVEKSKALDGWVEVIGQVLAEGGKRNSEERARALVVSLVGYATWASLVEASGKRTARARLADFLLDGVLS
jgi:hypothetical protein